MTRIAPLAHTPTAAAPEAAEKKPADPKVAKAAHEFEAALVRQLLGTMHFGGKKGDAYGGMVVDAMANSVSQGRGLGLSQLIQDSLTRAEHAPPKPEKT